MKNVAVTDKKTISFSKLIPDFKRFIAKKNKHLPILSYVYNDGKYTMAASAATALLISNTLISDNVSKGTLINPQTRKTIDSSLPENRYPDLYRVIPDMQDVKHIIHLDKYDIISLLSVFRKAKKAIKESHSAPVVCLNFDGPNRNLFITSHDRDVVTNDTIFNDDFEIGYYDDEPFETYLNVDYLINNLMVAKKVMNAVHQSTLNWSLVAPLRPMIFSFKTLFTCIILPIRYFPIRYNH